MLRHFSQELGTFWSRAAWKTSDFVVFGLKFTTNHCLPLCPEAEARTEAASVKHLESDADFVVLKRIKVTVINGTSFLFLSVSYSTPQFLICACG